MMLHVSGASRLAIVLIPAGFIAGCAPPPAPRKLEMEPIGTLRNVPTTPIEEPGDSGVTTPNSGTPLPASSVCTGADFDNVLDVLGQCEVTLPRASDVPSLKDKLEVKVATAAPSVAPGGRVEVVITLRSKTTDPLVIYFSGEPTPRVEIEASDGKGRRVDIPAAKWPGYPKGQKPEPREQKVSRITLEKGGAARIKTPWEALKTKWAPDKARTWEGRGYPRVPSGPLATGKYSLRVVLPILGDLGDVPKAPIEVGP